MVSNYFEKSRRKMYDAFSNQFSNKIEIDKIIDIPQWFNNFRQLEVIEEYYHKDTS